MKMVKKEEVEQLMLRYFPSCPLCGANAGYEVSGWSKNYVQCRSCGAKWQSVDFQKGKEIKTMILWKPDKQGKAKFLLRETKPVSFWQSLDLERERLEKEIEDLFRKLKNRNPKVRSEALNRLREIGQPVLEKLNEMSKAAYWGTRKEALGIRLLMEPELERREELLIQTLKQDEKDEIRVSVVKFLGLIEEDKKTGKAIEPLIEALKNDKSANVRVIAAQVLAFMKDPRVIEPLIQALNDKEYSTHARATVQQWASAALVKIGDKRGIAAIAPLAPHLLGTRWIPMDQIVRLGKAAVEPLIQALKHEDENVRKKAAEALGKIKSLKAVEPLIQALKDEDVDVRIKAAEALGEIGDARALEALTQAKEDKSFFVRSAVKGALRKIQKK